MKMFTTVYFHPKDRYAPRGHFTLDEPGGLDRRPWRKFLVDVQDGLEIKRVWDFHWRYRFYDSEKECLLLAGGNGVPRIRELESEKNKKIKIVRELAWGEEDPKRIGYGESDVLTVCVHIKKYAKDGGSVFGGHACYFPPEAGNAGSIDFRHYGTIEPVDWLNAEMLSGGERELLEIWESLLARADETGTVDVTGINLHAKGSAEGKNADYNVSTRRGGVIKAADSSMYKELRDKALTNYSTFEDVDRLGDWCDTYWGADSRYWDGFCYDTEDGLCVYPITIEVDEDEYERIGYEIR